jgi:hypothetical protein
MDRALYLSVIHHRPFLCHANFVRPFHGALNAIAYRVTSGSLYLLLQDVGTLAILAALPVSNDVQQHALVGMFAGTCNGVLLNHLQAIKYQMWTTNHRTTGLTVRSMYHQGGLRSFTNGIGVNVCRDVCFGLTYETTRYLLGTHFRGDTHKHTPGKDVLTNALAAGLGTIISSPLNYARNLKYGTAPGREVPTVLHLLEELRTHVLHHKTYKARFTILQRRLVLGWGTARVALGMALGQYIFDNIQRQMLRTNNMAQ